MDHAWRSQRHSLYSLFEKWLASRCPCQKFRLASRSKRNLCMQLNAPGRARRLARPGSGVANSTRRSSSNTADLSKCVERTSSCLMIVRHHIYIWQNDGEHRYEPRQFRGDWMVKRRYNSSPGVRNLSMLQSVHSLSNKILFLKIQLL